MDDYSNVDGQNSQAKSTDQVDDVAQALEAYKADENGKVVIPKDTPVHVTTALKLEQRRRNANSAYSKSETENLKLVAENAALKAKMADVVKPAGLSAEDIAELNDLKTIDIDAWFARKTALESKAKGSVQTVVDTALTEASAEAEVTYNQGVVKSRDVAIADMLTKHNTLNPETPITQDMLKLNIPPILVNQYASGELDGPGFMGAVSKFLYADRAMKTEQVMGQPDLGAAASSTDPSDTAKAQDLNSLYANI